MDTESELIAYLEANPPAKKFVPYCYRNLASDALTFYFEGDADYSERLSDHVTLYRSLETKELVGCRIKGIAGIIEDLPNFVKVRHDGIELSVLIFAFRGGADRETGDKLKRLAKAADERGMVLEGSS
jgi:hypothetical protein